MSERSGPMWLGLAGVAALVLVLLPLARGDDDADAGFDAYVQSGTCADPNDEFKVDLESDDDSNDIEPYVAVGHDGEPVTLGYYGAPELPGLSVAVIYSDEQFSMVITNPDDDSDVVACGDLLEPEEDRFSESGVAVVQLLPVGSSNVEGVATLERATLERELDITPTRARIILSTEGVSVPTEEAAGYEGFIQNGRCDAPGDDFEVELESEDDDSDVTPFQAISPEVTDPVTVAYYGSPGAPGFGLAAAYTDEEDFSLIIEDAESGDVVACGDILEPDDDNFTEAGLALVQLLPTGNAGVEGYAVMDRVTMQRELDVTPTLVRIVLFAAPITGGAT
jgi:hypothetical protein